MTKIGAKHGWNQRLQGFYSRPPRTRQSPVWAHEERTKQKTITLFLTAVRPLSITSASRSRRRLRQIRRGGSGRGRVAEWLCRGLQILVRRFDSGLGLHIPPFKRQDGFLVPSLPACLDPRRALTKRRHLIAVFSERETGSGESFKAKHSRPFPGSSAVEQAAVNRLVGGSNPSLGAKSGTPPDAITASGGVFLSAPPKTGTPINPGMTKNRIVARHGRFAPRNRHRRNRNADASAPLHWERAETTWRQKPGSPARPRSSCE